MGNDFRPFRTSTQDYPISEHADMLKLRMAGYDFRDTNVGRTAHDPRGDLFDISTQKINLRTIYSANSRAKLWHPEIVGIGRTRND